MAILSAKEFFGEQYGKAPVVVPAVESAVTIPPKEQRQSVFKSAWNKTKDIFKDAGERQINETTSASQVLADPKSSMNKKRLRILQTGLRTAGNVARTAGELLSAPVTAAVDKVAGKAGDSKIVQDIATRPSVFKGLDAANQGIAAVGSKYSAWKEKHPEMAADLEASTEIGLLVLGEKPASKVVETTSKAASAVAKGANDVIKPVKNTVNKATDAIQESLKRNAITDEEAVGKILQGKPQDIDAGLKTLKSIDATGVETYEELGDVLQARIKTLSRSVDEKLGADQTPKTIKQLETTTQVGEQTVKFNYVDQALKHLQELYQSASSPKDVARIKQLISKGKKEGFTAKEVNDIAREYGTEFGQKAFNPRTGEPITSVNAQSFENIRKGVKETARNAMPDENTKLIDQKISDAYTTKRLVDRMADNVNRLEQRVNQRGILEKVFRALASIVDIATLGGPKAFITKLFFPSNVGLKTLNSLDLEEQLARNLKIIQKANDGTDEGLIKALIERAKEYVKTNN